MKNGLQNEAEIDAEIIQSRFWAARGAADIDFDYFLGGFLRSPIFDEFSIGKKSAKNLKFAVRGRILGESLVEMGGVGG